MLHGSARGVLHARLLGFRDSILIVILLYRVIGSKKERIVYLRIVRIKRTKVKPSRNKRQLLVTDDSRKKTQGAKLFWNLVYILQNSATVLQCYHHPIIFVMFEPFLAISIVCQIPALV